MERVTAELTVSIVRFVEEHQPNIVACEFRDADSRLHTLVDKCWIFTADNLDADSEYPLPGVVRCSVLESWCDEQGRDLARISTEKPYAVESIEGLTEFVVLVSRLSKDHSG